MFWDIQINTTKSYIGPSMGAAGARELAGNIPSLKDGIVHPTINVDNLDPDCAIEGLVINEPRDVGRVDTILNMSFGMLGINSAVDPVDDLWFEKGMSEGAAWAAIRAEARRAPKP